VLGKKKTLDSIKKSSKEKKCGEKIRLKMSFAHSQKKLKLSKIYM